MQIEGVIPLEGHEKIIKESKKRGNFSVQREIPD
jgi:hypothetical protein